MGEVAVLRNGRIGRARQRGARLATAVALVIGGLGASVVGPVGVPGAAAAGGGVLAAGHNNFGQLGLGDAVDRPAMTAAADHDWVQLRAGDHTLALRADGTLWSWGRNAAGELGRPGSGNVPTRIGTDDDWARIDALASVSFAIRSDGSLWSWGDNADGQLGLGDHTDRAVPTRVGSGSAWTDVATGGSHVVARQQDGSLWVWGSNDRGQLGTGELDARDEPVRVGTDTDWASIAANDLHTLATKSDGTLWAWGYNAPRALGLGDDVDRHVPTQVGTETDWAEVEAGDNASLARKSDGTLWGFGSNTVGQLGLGATTVAGTPTQIGTDRWDWVQLNAHAVARRADGTLWVWGFNTDGQLGLGDTTTRFTPVLAGVDGTPRVAAAGESHTIVALAALLPPVTPTPGYLAGCGANYGGQVGDGSTSARPQMTPVGADGTWMQLSAGDDASFGIRADGTLWSWGANYSGMLGLGDLDQRNAPTQIGTDTDWASVSAGGLSAYALKTDGSLWAWGHGTVGELGVGDTAGRLAPTRVGTDSDWAQVSGGQFATAAIKADGTLWTWGDNEGNRLGNGTGPNVAVPTRAGTADVVGRSVTWADVSVGYSHMLAVGADGSLWSWGFNQYGQLGTGDMDTRDTPAQLGSSGYARVEAGFAASYAITTDGTLRSFGSGPIGLAGSPTALTPTTVAGGPWRAVGVGAYHAVGVQIDGTLWSWGADGFGQLCQPGEQANDGAPTQVGTDTDWLTAAAAYSHTVATKVTPVTVTNQAPFVSTPAGSFTVPEGSTLTFGAFVLDPDGDPVTGSWTPVERVTTPNSDTTDVPGVDDDSFVITYTACDDSGACGSSSSGVVVQNVAPTVNAGRNLRGPSALPSPLVATFTDPGVLDAHSATVDWGDGSAIDSFPSASVALHTSHLYAAGTYTLTVCVTDDDGGVGCDTAGRAVLATPGITVDDVSVTEGDPGDAPTTATAHVHLSGPATTPITVKYTVAAGTAKATSDYIAPTGLPATLTFAPGQTDLPIPISIVNDTLTETDETFSVKLATPVGAVIARPAATVTIVDEDPLIAVSIDPINVTEGDPGDPDLIVDVTAHLNRVAPADVSFDFATQAQTATFGKDYQRIAPLVSRLTIPAGELSVTVPVRIVNDGLPEADEIFLARISKAVEARIQHAVAPITIVDEDPVSIITIDPQSSAEADPAETNRFDIDVDMNPPSAENIAIAVAPKFTTTPGSATASDFFPALKSTTVVIPAGTTHGTYAVFVANDFDIEGPETFGIAIARASGGATFSTTPTTMTILDNDRAVSLLPIAPVDEGDTVVVRASIGSPADDDVTVDVVAESNGKAHAGTDFGSVVPTTATIPRGATFVDVSFPTVDDLWDEDDEIVNVRIASAINAEYEPSRTVDAVIRDNDTLCDEPQSIKGNVITGRPGLPDVLCGTPGDDVFVGLGGNDDIYGMGGRDTVSYATGTAAVQVDLQLGSGHPADLGNTTGWTNDELHGISDVVGTKYDDDLRGSSGDNRLTGGVGNDTLFGFGGNNVMTGGNGNDTLYAGPGTNEALGSAGNDVLVAGGGIDGFDGGLGIDTVSGALSPLSLTINLDAGTLHGWGSASLTGFESVFGSDQHDVITGNALDNRLYGNGGDDDIFGLDGNDTIFGLDGNDTISGGIGKDELRGEDGDDTIFGFDGDDLIQGNGGVDTLWGQDGNDTIFGGTENDTIHGGNGNDHLFGEEGENDAVLGDAGKDVVSGGPGASDFVDGGTEIDQCAEGEPMTRCP